MNIREAIDLGIIRVKEDHTFEYDGLCKECKYSKCTAYPASSNMCMNENCEWYGCFHVDHSLHRYVDGCWAFDKAK